jgi:CheY-like chemotaxis protein
VALNLITNASEALGENEGVIEVKVEYVESGAEARHIRFTVGDNGSGMTEEIQSKIFDPFFTTKFTGRGLGLAAVLGIIRAHGGSINVVSASGQGSRFEVLLPCTNLPVQDANDEPMPASASEPGIAGTILMVEDEEDLRSAVSKMLRKESFTVIEAPDGRIGVDLFREHLDEIDVVLLDLTLPRMNGKEVLQELRRMRPDVEVVITTAYSKDEALIATAGPQQWQFIRKPYRIAEMTALLRTLCARPRDTRREPRSSPSVSLR